MFISLTYGQENLGLAPKQEVISLSNFENELALGTNKLKFNFREFCVQNRNCFKDDNLAKKVVSDLIGATPGLKEYFENVLQYHFSEQCKENENQEQVEDLLVFRGLGLKELTNEYDGLELADFCKYYPKDYPYHYMTEPYNKNLNIGSYHSFLEAMEHHSIGSGGSFFISTTPKIFQAMKFAQKYIGVYSISPYVGIANSKSPFALENEILVPFALNKRHLVTIIDKEKLKFNLEHKSIWSLVPEERDLFIENSFGNYTAYFSFDEEFLLSELLNRRPNLKLNNNELKRRFNLKNDPPYPSAMYNRYLYRDALLKQKKFQPWLLQFQMELINTLNQHYCHI